MREGSCIETCYGWHRYDLALEMNTIGYNSIGDFAPGPREILASASLLMLSLEPKKSECLPRSSTWPRRTHWSLIARNSQNRKKNDATLYDPYSIWSMLMLNYRMSASGSCVYDEKIQQHDLNTVYINNAYP